MFAPDEREARLKKWFENHRAGLPEMAWHEFCRRCRLDAGNFLHGLAADPEADPLPVVEQISQGVFRVQGLPFFWII